MKLQKNIPLIDQHDKNFMYGGKFGGNFIPETLKKPVDDLTKLFSKLRKDKKSLKERDHYFQTYVGAPTPFIKLENLTKHVGWGSNLVLNVEYLWELKILKDKGLMLKL